MLIQEMMRMKSSLLSDKHLREAVKAGDASHEEARNAMKGRWKNPIGGLGWYNQVKKDFKAL